VTGADAIGLLELSSVAAGYRAADAMVKAAPVTLLMARSICSGKYLVVVGGNVASVNASVGAGAGSAEGYLIEREVISRIHPDIFPAIGMAVQLAESDLRALGVIETFSASSIVRAADAAVKAAEVKLFRVHLAMALGGKGFALVTGDTGSVAAAVEAGAAAADGMLAGISVIPAPDRALFREYI
jgi:microcompartment protein CcmL/EutN